MDLRERPNTLARLLSIVGHPAVVMPVAALIASSAHANTQLILQAFGLFALCALLVMSYSVFKTKRGDWEHVDASNKNERAELNRIVTLALLLISVVLYFAGANKGVVVALGLSACIVAAGHVLRNIAKPSLHVAFGVFAALITWPNMIAAIVMLALASAVAWSRLKLERHTQLDVYIGALLGIVAGIIYQVSLR